MKSVQSLLYSAFQIHANRTAVIEPDDGSFMTYAVLYDQASRVAGYLRAKGIQPGEYVVIALSRSSRYIVAETACLLFGYGAVLMDAAYPEERISYAAKDADAQLIIDEQLMTEMLAYPQRAEYHEVPADFPAVVIYTSGSTGRPKGILHDQGGMGGAVLRYQALLRTSEADTEGIISPFTFIGGCIVFLHPLCFGASVTIIPREVIVNPLALAEFIDRRRVSQILMPPSVLKLFKPVGHSLRVVSTGTERVSGLASDDFLIYNLYGMSETCAAVMSFPIDKPYANTPIGRAMEGCTVYLLDENGRKADEGEICVAGHCMTGYIGMPEKTAEVKVKNPYVAEDGYETMIRTGDLGRMDENGNIIYVNRKDWMMKINGQRVEPGEIEAVIKEIPQIANAAVKGFIDANNHSYLCAYYVTKGDIQESEIRLAISKRLPQYMMPAYFVELDAIPLNANGKMNRLALLAPDAARFASDYAAPTNETEERLCRVMAEVLGVERVGIHDDFFQIGGDSIGCMSVIAEMDDPRIGTKLIYTGRTPAAIAAGMAVQEIEDEDELNRRALAMDQPLIPYQTYYLDYQLYSPRLVVTNLPFVCCAPREKLDAQALKMAVERVTHHFAIFGTVFTFNEANELVQRYWPERIPSIEVVEASETEFHAGIKDAFFKPFRMLNSILWRGQIVVTEANVYLMLDFNHAISDGTMAMQTFRQIFETLNGRALQKDYYYLFLQRHARFMETQEGAAELESVRKLYDGDWSRFPQPDFDARENSNRRIVAISSHTSEAYQTAAAGKRISLGAALVTAGQLALSRFNRQKRVAVEWIYNGRNEQWKNNLIGITICGIPATMDFDQYAETDAILEEARRQNVWGLRYAEHSYALRDMSPAKNECMKIVYEHGIDIPENIPEWFQIEADTDHFTGMLGLFQIIIFEGTPDAPLTLIVTYQGSRYREESAKSILGEFERALNELLGLSAIESERANANQTDYPLK